MNKLESQESRSRHISSITEKTKNFQSDTNKVLREMIEEKVEKESIKIDETQHLITSLVGQRNNALNKLAVEQARNKALLKLLTIKETEIISLKNSESTKNV